MKTTCLWRTEWILPICFVFVASFFFGMGLTLFERILPWIVTERKMGKPDLTPTVLVREPQGQLCLESPHVSAGLPFRQCPGASNWQEGGVAVHREECPVCGGLLQRAPLVSGATLLRSQCPAVRPWQLCRWCTQQLRHWAGGPTGLVWRHQTQCTDPGLVRSSGGWLSHLSRCVSGVCLWSSTSAAGCGCTSDGSIACGGLHCTQCISQRCLWQTVCACVFFFLGGGEGINPIGMNNNQSYAKVVSRLKHDISLYFILAPNPGHVCLVHRGSCSFLLKAKHCSDAGAVGVIVVNGAGQSMVVMTGVCAQNDCPQYNSMPKIIHGISWLELRTSSKSKTAICSWNIIFQTNFWTGQGVQPFSAPGSILQQKPQATTLRSSSMA